VPVALIGRYLALLIAPLQLSIEYGTTIRSHVSLRDPYLWLGFFTIAMWIGGMAASLYRRKVVLTFCFLAMAMFYMLIGNVVTIIGTVFAERLIYLPSVFFLILIAAALARLRRRAMIVLASVFIALLSIRTATYAAEWNDALRFYQRSRARHPEAVRLHMLTAEELQRRGDLQGAKLALADGRASLPNYWRVWMHSAILALQMDELDEATVFIKKATELYPVVHNTPIANQIAKRRAARATTMPATPATTPAATQPR
jgi:tetratricopeptide (TPR) repeat protein